MTSFLANACAVTWALTQQVCHSQGCKTESSDVGGGDKYIPVKWLATSPWKS